MEQKNILKITFLISLLAHILIGILIYFAFDKRNLLDSKLEEKKVKLAFKRGGDSMREDSNIKENTSISQSQIQEMLNQQSQQANNQISKTTPDILQKQENHKQIPQPQHTKDADKNVDLSSLQLYSQDTLQNNINSQNTSSTQSNLSQILKNIPKDQRDEILDLYGDELGDYGEAERDFIVNNLRDIGRITQYYLNLRGYPPDAGYLGQQGKNAVEFYLHPNGDISDLHIIVDSKSMILDKNSLKTIQIAYKDYPRPTTKTKIRIYVKYYLYYY